MRWSHTNMRPWRAAPKKRREIPTCGHRHLLRRELVVLALGASEKYFTLSKETPRKYGAESVVYALFGFLGVLDIPDVNSMVVPLKTVCMHVDASKSEGLDAREGLKRSASPIVSNKIFGYTLA